MTTATDTTPDNTDQSHTPPKTFRYFRLTLIALCIGAGLLATTGWILGAYELVSPTISMASLLLSILVALGWLITSFVSIWPLVSKKRWFALFCTFLQSGF